VRSFSASDADIATIRAFAWQRLRPASAFTAWRDAKIKCTESLAGLDPVEIGTLAAPAQTAVCELAGRCQAVNSGQYHTTDSGNSERRTMADLVAFARHFGLRVAEAHRSAEDHGVVALKTSSEEGKKGYIPYTPRALNWHTDGYYNAPDEGISAFVLHCLRPAREGGENRIVDPEIAYLRLREADPDYVRALMHPAAMTIPENREADGSLRPVSAGPVFHPDPATGRLQMRYTARTRSIEWRDDALTREAVDWLAAWLASDDPLIRTVRLEAGAGLLNNNALHNRSRFADDDDPDRARVMLRVRFHNRVAEDDHGQA